VEFHEKNRASSQYQCQKDVFVLIAVHEVEADNHDHLVEVEQEICSGIHSGSWVAGCASTLEVGNRDRQRDHDENDTDDDREHCV
jgi:hypothetical protein